MATSAPPTESRPSPLAVAGLASVGAGIIHVGIGVGHRSDGEVLALSWAIALLQVGWGGWALGRSGRDGRTAVAAGVGAAISVGALVGWAVAKVSGIAFIDGLSEPEPIGLVDGAAAALAFVALVFAFRALQVGTGDGVSAGLRLGRVASVTATVVVAGSVAVAVVAAAEDQPEDRTPLVAQAPPLAASVDTQAENRLFDPAEPIDLSGVPGVTEAELARAEDLVVSTLESLGRFSDRQVAIDAGYQSLGDAFTGHEHLVNWDLIDDGRVLDPNKPESLVYEVDDDGDATLAAAMYLLPTGSRLTNVPEVGGSLTPWHVHENICVTSDPDAAVAGSVTDATGSCPPGQELFSPVPMLHVWVTPHPCGPFASLESVAGLEVDDDQRVFCDHIHGA